MSEAGERLMSEAPLLEVSASSEPRVATRATTASAISAPGNTMKPRPMLVNRALSGNSLP